MKIRVRIRRKRSSRGSTLVEFALCSFLLVMLSLGVIEVGRMVLIYSTMAQASRAGMRYAIVHGADLCSSTTAVSTLVKNVASAGLLSTSRVNVAIDTSSLSDCTDPSNYVGKSIKITVDYTYDPFNLFFNNLLNKKLASVTNGNVMH